MPTSWCVPLRLAGAGLGITLGCLSMAACTDESPGQGAARERALVWADEFDGAAGALPNPDNWTFETFGDGSGNEELQCYTAAPGNTSTDGAGHLVITAIRQPGHRCIDDRTNDFTSGRITTQGRHTWTYGRLEVRAKVPAGVGTWPAFWALGANKPEVGWPAAGEIDVMEYVGQDPTSVLGTIHGPTSTGERWYLNERTDLAAPLSDAFHVFAVEWTEGEMVWSVDDEEYGRITRDEAEQQGTWVFDKPFYLLLNLAIGGTLGGTVPPETTFPQTYVVDYVRVYQ